MSESRSLAEDAVQPDGGSAGGRGWRWRWGWFAFWVVLLVVWRAEVLAWPPYWDSILGLWWEASYLAETDFDYRRLWYDEPDTYHGGARVYLLSVLPTLIAGLMRALPTAVGAIVGYRLFVFGCVAVVLVRVQEVVAERWGRGLGVLAAAAVVTTPLFSAQAELLGMEIPLACCVVLAADGVWRDRLAAATGWGVAAFFVKFTGLLVTASLMGWLGLRVVLGRRELSRTGLWRVWTALLANAVWLFVAVRLMDMTQALNKWVAPADRTIYTGPTSMLVWCPDVALIGGVVMVAIVASLWRAVRSGANEVGRWRGWLVGVGRWVNARRGVVFSVALVVGLFWATTQVSLIPRYLTVAVPLMYMTASQCVGDLGVGRRWLAVVLVLVVGFNLANQYGRFLPQQTVWFGSDLGRTGSALERSLEYRADHAANIETVAFLARECQDDAIIVGHPFIKAVADPRMGYVEESLRGYTIHPYLDATGRFETIDMATLAELPADAVLVGVFGNSWYLGASLMGIPRPGENDQVLYDDRQLSPVLVYRKGWPERLEDQSSQQLWYLSQYWPSLPAERRAEALTEFCESRGDTAREEALARAVVEQDNNAIGARLVLAETLWGQGEWNEGIAEWLGALLAGEPAEARDGELVRAWLQPLGMGESFAVGCEAVARGDLRTAKTAFGASALELPEAAWPRYALAMCAVRVGDYEAGVKELEEALARAPDLRQARRQLGYTHLMWGAWDKAREALEEVVAVDETDGEAWIGLGLVEERAGNWNAAAERFARALALRPWSEQVAAWHKQVQLRAGGAE